MINVAAKRTLKYLPLSISYKSALATPLRRIMRINIANRDSKQLGLIFNHLLKLIERPTVQGIAKGF